MLLGRPPHRSQGLSEVLCELLLDQVEQSEQLAGIKITEMIAKKKLLWKGKIEAQRKLKVNFLNRN